MSWKGSWRKIATIVASHLQVIGQDASVGASGTQARSRREGRKAHTGRSLMQVASPDEVLRHRPLVCDHCQQPLEGIAGHEGLWSCRVGAENGKESAADQIASFCR